MTTRESQTRCTEVTARTHYGPDQRWDACAAVTEWSNGEGVDVRVNLGPHASGMMSLTWDEVDVLVEALSVARNDDGVDE